MTDNTPRLPNWPPPDGKVSVDEADEAREIIAWIPAPHAVRTSLVCVQEPDAWVVAKAPCFGNDNYVIVRMCSPASGGKV